MKQAQELLNDMSGLFAGGTLSEGDKDAVMRAINLMLIKLNEMNRMGYNLNLPYLPSSDFLKNIRPE